MGDWKLTGRGGAELDVEGLLLAVAHDLDLDLVARLEPDHGRDRSSGSRTGSRPRP